MPKSPEATRHHNSTKSLIFLPLRAIQFCPFQYDTPYPVLEKYQKLTANRSSCVWNSPINSGTTTTLRYRERGSIYCLSTGYYETIKKGFSTCCTITTTCNRLQRQFLIVLYLILQWWLMLDIGVFMPEAGKIISKLI